MPSRKPGQQPGNRNNRHGEKDGSYKVDNNKHCKGGTDPEYLTAVIPAEQARQLGKHGGDRKSEGRNQDSNSYLDKSRGAEYQTERIARERPRQAGYE